MTLKKGLVISGILTGLGLFAYAFYRYAKQQTALLENYTYKILRIKFDVVNLQVIKGKVNILFSSSSDIEVIVSEFYMDFYFNNKKVGYLTDATQFVIPARGSAEIPLDFTLNPQVIFSSATDILAFTLKKQDAAVSVIGYATLKSGFITATLPITYDTTIKEILSS
jgi:hypothetical protein